MTIHEVLVQTLLIVLPIVLFSILNGGSQTGGGNRHG